jgi:hypothetical protein
MNIADDINAEHRLVETCFTSSMGHYIRCGELILKQKERLKHGELKPWIAANCEFSYETARDYMRAAKEKSRGLPFSSLADLLAKTRKKRFINQDWEQSDPALVHTVTAAKMLTDMECSVRDLDQQSFDPATEEFRRLLAAAAALHAAIVELREALTKKTRGLPEAPYDRETAFVKLWEVARMPQLVS